MTRLTRRAALGMCLTALAACGARPSRQTAHYSGNTPEMRRLVAQYADLYDMPESLIHRIIRRESGYNPAARNGSDHDPRGPALPVTARSTAVVIAS